MQTMADECAGTTSTEPVVPVALAELTSSEWVHLTVGLFWRSLVWALVASVVGSALSIGIAYVENMVIDGELHPDAYRWTAGVSMVVVTLLVLVLMFAWFTR